jgi:hypothetical protein
MDGPLTGIGVFICLVLSTLLGAAAHGRVRDMIAARGSSVILRHILGVVAVVAAIFMTVTTLSLKVSFDTAGREVGRFSSLVIDLDRALRRVGLPSEDARELLFRYSDRMMMETWRSTGAAGLSTEPSDLLLAELDAAIGRIPTGPPDDRQAVNEARRLLQGVAATRWALEGRTGGSLSTAMLAGLVLLMMLTFASLGFAAPRNRLMAGMLVLAALSIGGGMFLLEEYDDPFSGVIVISRESVENALFMMTD